VLSYEMDEWQFIQWLAEHGLSEHQDRLKIWHLRGRVNPLQTEKGRAHIADMPRHPRGWCAHPGHLHQGVLRA
jgi:hypothetical protein